MNEVMRALLMLPEQASTVSGSIDRLHYVVIATTMLGATGVALATLYFIVKYRAGAHRGGHLPPDPREGHARGGIPIAAELAVSGVLLALFVSWWVVGFRQFIHLYEPPRDSVTIYVTGKQWMWSFAYPDGSGSNAVLYVPAGRPVKLVMTSRDVIHSFFVPAFRVKQDVVPGRATTMWFEVERPGTYPIYCTEYCGAGHSTMRAQVIALDPAAYDRRIEGMRAGADGATGSLSLAEMGERVAARSGCLRCHTVDGTAHTGPTWAGMYGAEVPLAGGGRAVADEAYLTESMMDPAGKVHLGFQPVMPSYQGLLTAAQVGALVELIRSLRDVPRRTDAAPPPVPARGEVPLVQPLEPAPGAAPARPEAP